MSDKLREEFEKINGKMPSHQRPLHEWYQEYHRWLELTVLDAREEIEKLNTYLDEETDHTDKYVGRNMELQKAITKSEAERERLKCLANLTWKFLEKWSEYEWLCGEVMEPLYEMKEYIELMPPSDFSDQPKGESDE